MFVSKLSGPGIHITLYALWVYHKFNTLKKSRNLWIKIKTIYILVNKGKFETDIKKKIKEIHEKSYYAMIINLY